MKSLIDTMRPYSDLFNFPSIVKRFWKEEMDKCQDFEYWFYNYYRRFREDPEWRKIDIKWKDQD